MFVGSSMLGSSPFSVLGSAPLWGPALCGLVLNLTEPFGLFLGSPVGQWETPNPTVGGVGTVKAFCDWLGPNVGRALLSTEYKSGRVLEADGRSGRKARIGGEAKGGGACRTILIGYRDDGLSSDSWHRSCFLKI